VWSKGKAGDGIKRLPIADDSAARIALFLYVKGKIVEDVV
jgi:hypothetical protein